MGCLGSLLGGFLLGLFRRVLGRLAVLLLAAALLLVVASFCLQGGAG